jgi:hypothetical protein
MRRASSTSSGIVAVITRTMPSTRPAAWNARSCSGVVKSQTFATPSDRATCTASPISPGNAGRTGSNRPPHCSGNMMVVSSPYMCCGCTVPTTAASVDGLPSACREHVRAADQLAPRLAMTRRLAGRSGRMQDGRLEVQRDRRRRPCVFLPDCDIRAHDRKAALARR